MRLLWIVAVSIFSSLAVSAAGIETSVGRITVEKVMGGFVEPWGLGFTPDGGFLVTERGGRLTHVSPGGTISRVRGLPNIAPGGQGGLLDVMIPRDFAESRLVFVSYSILQKGRTFGTAIAVGKLSNDGAMLENVRTIFEMSAGSKGKNHFGGRLVEAADGKIFLTIGDRKDRPSAQDLSRHNGSIIRINRDGSVPSDNPFVGREGVLPEIWSFGHRNPQGAALDLQGRLWIDEHGAKGGDEVNQIRRGANYGWPVISYGTHYSGAKIGEGTRKAGMEQPEYYWDPSIAPSGMMIYSGKLWPAWAGNIFIGSLKFNYLSRLDPKRGWSEEKIQNNQTMRVRDVREAPDGSIWFLSVGKGAVFRVTPG